MTRKVPARRHNPEMQEFPYKGYTDAATLRKDQEAVARIAAKVRKELELHDRDHSGNGSD